MAPSKTRSDSQRTRNTILECVKAFEAEGRFPIAREIAQRCGRSHSNVRRHVAALVAEGTLDIQERPVQSIRREIRTRDGRE